MRRVVPWLPTCLLLTGTVLLARGDGTFIAPLDLPGLLNATWAAPAHLDGDGAMDIAVVHGTSEIKIFLQTPGHRDHWTAAPTVSAGNGNYFVLAADLDGDGGQDLAVADPGSTTFVVKGRGDGTFEDAVPVDRTVNSRVVVASDFDGDGILDLASLDAFQSFSVHRGLGGMRYQYLRSYDTMNAHDMLVLDYDSNAVPDLFVKTKETGIFPFRGNGDGSFAALPLVDNLTVRGPIASADFDGDGRGDLMTNYAVGISRGDGTFRKTLDLDRPFMPVGAGDLTGDGHPDAVITDLDRSTLEVHPGIGDGTFRLVARFPLGRELNSFVVADVDDDGQGDLVGCGAGGLSITWGKGGERFLAVPVAVSFLGEAKAMAVGELDRDGAADMFIPSLRGPEVRVLLGAGRSSAPGEARTIPTSRILSSVEPLDLDGDGATDLLGVDGVDSVVIVLLDAEGGVRSDVSIQVGSVPTSLTVGHIDAGPTLDLAVPCVASQSIAVLAGRGDGSFEEPRRLSAASAPSGVAIGDVDGDGNVDLVVSGQRGVSVHPGSADGSHEDPFGLPGDVASRSVVCTADLDGDGDLDVLAAGASGIVWWRGTGSRVLEDPRDIVRGERILSLDARDLDGDGLSDVTAGTEDGALVCLNDEGVFPEPRRYRLGSSMRGHRIADFDGDGVADLTAFDAQGAAMVFGRKAPGPAPFRRGDADGDGTLGLTDAVSVLTWLFRGGEAPACRDASDANHDGQHDITDAVRILLYLFLGGDPPPAPGPADCGPGPEPSLGCDRYACPGA